jgi:hypothetical protein
MKIQSFNKQATVAGEKGFIFFHLKPLKSVCQSKSRTRPSQTTAWTYHRLKVRRQSKEGRDMWVRAGSGRRAPDISDAAGEAELPELAEVVERRRPLGNRGRMGTLAILSGRFRAHRCQ